jgi:dihydrofolate reductase
MRKLIAGMKTSLDQKIEGADGFADWVDAWSDDYGVSAQIDACLLGGGMYPGYETYWTALRDAPDQPLPMTGKLPTAAEIEWGHLTARVPHYVLSRTINSAQWPTTHFLRSIDDVAEMKQKPGQDIYLVGGARLTASLIDAGLVDELRLIVHPLIAGSGKPLFGTLECRHALDLNNVERLDNGRVRLTYDIC